MNRFIQDFMMKQTHWLLGMLFLFITPLTIAQDSLSLTAAPTKKYAKYLDVRLENGAMLGTGSELSDQLINASYYNGFDVRLGFRKTDPDDVYSNVYRRPYLGVGYYNSTFHNDDIGKPNALYFFLTVPIAFEQAKKLTFSYSAAFGLSYNFNPYDSINNTANIFIGSYRNCYVHLGFVANYKFNEKWAVNGTLGFKHFSNGSFKQPNLGINLIPVTVAVSYKMSKDPIDQYKKPIPAYLRHSLVNVTFSGGSKNYKSGEDNHFKTMIGVNYLRQINYKYRLGIGMDFFYADAAELRNTSDASDFSKSFSYAIVGSWEWVLTERLYAPIAIAFYLHRNEENGEITPYYERVGLRYRITDHLVTGVTIKAHKGVADIFEWTIGYTFHHDPN